MLSPFRLLFICVTYLALLIPTQTQAAENMIFKSGAWKVSTNQYTGGGVYCSATVESQEIIMSLLVDDDAKVKIFFTWPGSDLTGYDGPVEMNFRIDAKSPWVLHNGSVFDSGFVFYMPASETAGKFYNELAWGKRMWLLNQSGGPIDMLVLDGSKPALEILADCLKILRN